MSGRKTPTIPDIQGIDDNAVARILRPMREQLNNLTGRSGTPIAQLQGTAALLDIQNKVNEIIARLNA